jgi:hypothetical protein
VDDEKLFGDLVPAAAVEVVSWDPDDATDADVAKATVLLRLLADACIRPPFDFRPDDAKRLWGVRLGRFPMNVLAEVVNEIVGSGEREFPVLGEVETLASFIVNERAREHVVEDARNVGPCSECDDAHWVRVEIPAHKLPDNGMTHFMRPCERCLPEMYELYIHGHLTIEHADKGGCPTCRPRAYDPPKRPKRYRVKA